MGRGVVNFHKTWLDTRLDLKAFDIDGFHTVLSRQQKGYLTLGVLALYFVFSVFLSDIAGLIVLVTGLWVIWNPNDQITRTEKKVFLTALVLVLFFSFLTVVSLHLQATGLFIVVTAAILVGVWRK